MSQIPFHFGEAFISFSYILPPLILGLIHAQLKRKSRIEYLLRYYLFIGIGIQGLLTGIVQMFFPELVVKFTQWPISPFILELGMANLSYGILGIISPWMNKGWQEATALGYGLFLFFTGVGHVVDLIQNGANHGNAGTFLLSDLLVALALFILVALHRIQHIIYKRATNCSSERV